MLELHPGPARARPRGGVVTLFGTLLLGVALLISLPGSTTAAGAPPVGGGSQGDLNEMCGQVVPYVVPIPTPAPNPYDDEVFAYYNFEQGLEPWIPVTDSAYHDAFLKQAKGDNGCPDMKGWHFAQLATPPKLAVDPPPHELHASWVSADFPVAGSGYRLVTVQWSARWSQDPSVLVQGLESIPAVYVGTSDPTDEAQFTRLEGKLTQDWQTFTYKTYIKVGTPQTSAAGTMVHIGIGWSDAGASVDLDCGSITIAYPPAAGAR